MSLLANSKPRSAAPMVRAAAMVGIAPEGAMLAFGPAVAGLVLVLAGIRSLGGLVILLALAIGAFFRDPERRPPGRGGIVLSGADGKVTDIGEGVYPSAPEGRFKRVSVFMSPLDVHVNRASVGGEVLALKHTAGEFRAAFSDYASEHNERNLIVLGDDAGRRHAMVQVAGYLARRIVCRLSAHERVEAGGRIGLIMFGSRVDHFVPLEYSVVVRVGERVRAGESVIGELQQ